MGSPAWSGRAILSKGVDWQFNVRLWDIAANSGISCETLAD